MQTLIVISNVLPVDYHALHICLNRYYVLHRIAFSPSSFSAIKFLVNEIVTFDIDTRRRIHVSAFPPRLASSFVNVDLFDDSNLQTSESPTIKIYTFGAKSSQGAGSAAMISRENYSVKEFLKWKLSSHATAKQAATYAVLFALRHLSQVDQESNIHIYSDCLTLLKEIKMNSRLSTPAREIITLISTRKLKVTFRWIEG